MSPETLGKELVEAGLHILGVTPHAKDPNVIVVYLDGYSGEWAHEYATDLIKEVPGVKEAQASTRTPAIILVLLEAPVDCLPENAATAAPGTASRPRGAVAVPAHIQVSTTEG